jgi:hypothetical protein
MQPHSLNLNFFNVMRSSLRRIRKEMVNKKQFSIYLAYAVGEIILVVLGILIALQIDDWNRERELNEEELESYQIIVADLKRDSTLFVAYKRSYNTYLDTYFQMNEIKKGRGSFNTVLPDHLVSNIQFNPVMGDNHQTNIEKIRNRKIREQINNYFGRINQVEQATEEFNGFITQESRPFFLKEQEIFQNATVFDSHDKIFPPFKRVSTIDTVKLGKIMPHPYFLPILSQLRMSIGFYLASLELTMEENHKLIQNLKSASK